MLSKGKTRGTTALRRDVFLSVLIGPLGTAIPVLGYFILFPIIVHRSGLAVLGVWSLLSSFGAYLHTADVGFSLLINREAGRDRSREELADFHRDRLAARRLYFLTGAALLAVLLAGHQYIFLYFGNAYPADGLLLASLILVFGTTIEVTAKLDAAVIAARSHNYVVQIVKSLIPVLALAAAIAGALIGKPIEGFALGRVLKGAAEIAVYRWWIARHHREWLDARAPLPPAATWPRVRSLVRRGWQLSAISWLSAIWEPLLRVVIGSVAGLPAVGVFEIAMKIISTLRNAIATGFGSLLPALAQLHRLGDREGIIKIIRESLYYLLGVGVGALGFFAMTADKILYLWLGELPEGAVFATRIIAVWSIIGLLGVPYYYLLQAVGRQAIISFGVIIQIIFLVAVMPFGRAGGFGLDEILIYVVSVCVFVNVLTFWFAEKYTSCFIAVIRDARLLVLMGVGLAVIIGISSVAAGGRLDEANPLSGSIYPTVIFLTAYVFFASAIFGSKIKDFFTS